VCDETGPPGTAWCTELIGRDKSVHVDGRVQGVARLGVTRTTQAPPSTPTGDVDSGKVSTSDINLENRIQPCDCQHHSYSLVYVHEFETDSL